MNPLVSPLSCMPLARLVAASMAAGNRAIIVDDTTTPPLIGNDPYVLHSSPAIVTERREIDHDAIAAKQGNHRCPNGAGNLGAQPRSKPQTKTTVMTARRYRYEDPQTQYENSAEFRSITDRNKITIKFHRGRLCCWPGNVQRWIHPDNSGEVSVDGVPVLGHVIATRMNQGPLTDTILTASVPKALWPNIANGMPVVINRQQLPAHVANLI